MGSNTYGKSISQEESRSFSNGRRRTTSSIPKVFYVGHAPGNKGRRELLKGRTSKEFHLLDDREKKEAAIKLKDENKGEGLRNEKWRQEMLINESRGRRRVVHVPYYSGTTEMKKQRSRRLNASEEDEMFFKKKNSIGHDDIIKDFKDSIGAFHKKKNFKDDFGYIIFSE